MSRPTLSKLARRQSWRRPCSKSREGRAALLAKSLDNKQQVNKLIVMMKRRTIIWKYRKTEADKRAGFLLVTQLADLCFVVLVSPKSRPGQVLQCVVTSQMPRIIITTTTTFQTGWGFPAPRWTRPESSSQASVHLRLRVINWHCMLAANYFRLCTN